MNGTVILHLRVKFRALGITFGTVEREIDASLAIRMLVERILKRDLAIGASALPIPPVNETVIYDDRGVRLALEVR